MRKVSQWIIVLASQLTKIPAPTTTTKTTQSVYHSPLCDFQFFVHLRLHIHNWRWFYRRYTIHSMNPRVLILRPLLLNLLALFLFLFVCLLWRLYYSIAKIELYKFFKNFRLKSLEIKLSNTWKSKFPTIELNWTVCVYVCPPVCLTMCI